MSFMLRIPLNISAKKSISHNRQSLYDALFTATTTLLETAFWFCKGAF